MKDATIPVVCQYWEESERGWGVRPDGCSLHLTEADRKQFIKEYWDIENGVHGSDFQKVKR